MNMKLAWYDLLFVLAFIAAFGYFGAILTPKGGTTPTWFNPVMIGIAVGYFGTRFSKIKAKAQEQEKCEEEAR